MMTYQHTDPESLEVCLRWHQATVRNAVNGWRALSHWLAAESLIFECDGMYDNADDMRVISDLANQRYLDLMPRRIDDATLSVASA